MDRTTKVLLAIMAFGLWLTSEFHCLGRLLPLPKVRNSQALKELLSKLPLEPALTGKFVN